MIAAGLRALASAAVNTVRHGSLMCCRMQLCATAERADALAVQVERLEAECRRLTAMVEDLSRPAIDGRRVVPFQLRGCGR